MKKCAHALVALVMAVAGLAATGSPASAASGFTYSVDAVFSPEPGKLRLYGWAYDNDVPGAVIEVHVYVGGPPPEGPGVSGYPLLANQRRDDVQIYPHGFDYTLDVPRHGRQPVLVYAINSSDGPPGGNELIWSGEVDIANPPPDTYITRAPAAQGNDPAAVFEFSASESSAFFCRWDGGAQEVCTSPAARSVNVGRHTFEVWAVDAEGASDPTPATYSWTVTAPPTPTPTPTPSPTPTPTPAPTPTPVVVPTPPAPGMTLRLRAVRKKSRVKVDVGPDLESSNYRFTVQRRAGRKWRTVRRTQTLGPRDLMVLDLPRGTYRVVVPRQHGMAGTSATVRLRR